GCTGLMESSCRMNAGRGCYWKSFSCMKNQAPQCQAMMNANSCMGMGGCSWNSYMCLPFAMGGANLGTDLLTRLTFQRTFSNGSGNVMVSVMGGLNANIGGGISAGLFGDNAYYPPMMYR